MRNLLGRLHARHVPELLRIAEAWGVPLRGESKGEIVAALYRAMTDLRALRDMWDRLDTAERALVLSMADAPEPAAAPTIPEMASRLGVAEEDARETALRLYRAGFLAREGDDDPLPIGMPPRVILPREIALHVRRVQDEMAAGDLAQAPLRVLLELLDDAELEAAARAWGLRIVSGVTTRADLSARLLRLANDRARVDRVVRGRGRDAAAIWKVVSAAEEPALLAEAAARAGLGRPDTATGARLRAALAELEGALLVWHAYGPGQTRRLFIPAEIRAPGEAPTIQLPALVAAEVEDAIGLTHWRHPDALAWDLLTVLRVAADRQAPLWETADAVPRWLGRAVNQRLWLRGEHSPPTGYLELLQSLAISENLLAVDEHSRPERMVLGPNFRAWRSLSFPQQTIRLRECWLRLPRWVEGEPVGAIEIWGADWRGLRPRLLAGLADPEVGLAAGAWVTLESLAARVAERQPRLLGPSFSAATARVGSESRSSGDERKGRAGALADVAAVELSGPFVWFGLTEIADVPGRPRAIRLTETGAALAARKEPAMAAPESGVALLRVDPSGEIALHSPSPDRVWALLAFAEPVALGPVSYYRLTSASVAAALAAGIEREQIATFLERASRQPLAADVAALLEGWARAMRRVRLQRAAILSVDDEAERAPLLLMLGEEGWSAEPLSERAVLVALSAPAGTGDPEIDESRLIETLRNARYSPVRQFPADASADGSEGAAPDAPAAADPGAR